jgi:hypothetical protein
MQALFRGLLQLLQILAWIAAIVSAIVAVTILVNRPSEVPRGKPPGIYIGA